MFHLLNIATSKGNLLQLQYSFHVFVLALPLVRMQMGHATSTIAANTPDTCFCYQWLLVVCRYSQSEFASVTFAMCMASSPVEGTVHGTKGSIKLHNAMHCPTKISIELSGQQNYCLMCCTCASFQRCVVAKDALCQALHVKEVMVHSSQMQA